MVPIGLNVILPPAAMGPVVALIGLELASTAANTGGLLAEGGPSSANIIVFLVTFGYCCFWFRIVPQVLCGYPHSHAAIWWLYRFLFCWSGGFGAVSAANWFSLPNFSTPKFSTEAIIIMLPALLVIISEHIGHQIVTSKIIGHDLLKDPGLHRSLFADNFSTMLSGFIGSVPTTTYGENIGVMAITKVYSVRVIAGAADSFDYLFLHW